MEQAADRILAAMGRVQARQGRLAEGEATVRRALLNRLQATGKYNLQAANFVGFLANLLVEEGRQQLSIRPARRLLSQDGPAKVPNHRVPLSRRHSRPP